MMFFHPWPDQEIGELDLYMTWQIIQHAVCSALSLISLSLQNKAARGYGAGVYLSESNAMTIVNSTLVDNFASFSGGAAFVRHSANLSIVGSTINDNLANIYGAGKSLFCLLFRALFVCFAMRLGSVLCSFVCFTKRHCHM
jgi:hypothetical protein